jgi:ribosomal protein S12 methylthiotransferase accessory factor
MIDRETEAAGPKRYRDGTHRVVDPEATLARVMPLVAAMGVTRVAVLTGLDTIGIPVAAATRPNSRSIAVHQGKGISVAAAKASAVMEAVEMFHAEHVMLPLRLASYAELSSEVPVADPDLLPRCRGASEVDRLLWVEAQDLMSGEPLWVPHELVSADFTFPSPVGAGVLQATTNGLASGNHQLEVILHGLYEVVERDAIALWRAADQARDECAVDPASVDGPASQALLELYKRAGILLRIWDVTSDIRLPVFVCLAMAPDPTEGVEPELGSGCHADRDIALSRALTEAAQARLTRISGARDDFLLESYDSPVRLARHESARRLLGKSPPRRNFRAVPTWAGPTLRHDLDAALSCLSNAGLRQVAWVDLTRPEFRVPVGRIVVPGLEGPWTPESGDYRPGQRSRAVSGRV